MFEFQVRSVYSAYAFETLRQYKSQRTARAALTAIYNNIDFADVVVLERSPDVLWVLTHDTTAGWYALTYRIVESQSDDGKIQNVWLLIIEDNDDGDEGVTYEHGVGVDEESKAHLGALGSYFKRMPHSTVKKARLVRFTRTLDVEELEG